MSRIVYAWRQIRADGGPLITIFALMLVTSFLAAALPRWLNATDDRAIVSAIEHHPVPDVIAQVAVQDQLQGDIVTRMQRDQERVVESLQPVLANVLGTPVSSAATTAMEVKLFDGDPPAEGRPTTTITPRLLLYDGPTVTYVEGTEPAEGSYVDGPFPMFGKAYEVDGVRLRVTQIGLAKSCTDPAALTVGSMLTGSIGGVPAILQVSGIYEPVDAHSYVWLRNSRLVSPTLEYTLNGLSAVTCDAYINPTSWEDLRTALLASPPGIQITNVPPMLIRQWDFPVDGTKVNSRSALSLLNALNRANTTHLQATRGTIAVSTSVQRPVEEFLEQQSASHAVIAIGTAGALVIALIVLALAAQLTISRRRAALVLARARGSSVAQVVGVVVLEGLVAAGIAGVAGWWLARWVVDASFPSSTGAVLVGVLVAGTVLALAGFALWVLRTGLRQERESVTTSARSPRRVAVEVALIAVAITAVLLLRQRGLSATVVGTTVDPLLVAAPILVAVAAAIITLRIYPLPVRFLTRLMANRPGAVGFLGVARASRTSVATAAPLLALLVASSFAVFGAAVQHTVRTDQGVVAWQTVGADFRTNGSDFNPDVDVPRIAAAAGATVDDVLQVREWQSSLVDSLGGRGSPFTLVMLDPQAYRDFLAERPIDTTAFQALVDAPATSDTVVPAVASPGLNDALNSDKMSNEFLLPGKHAEFSVVNVTDTFPGLQPNGLWAVVRTTDAQVVADLPYWPTALYIDAPTDTAAATKAADVRAAVRASQPYSPVVSRVELYDRLAKAPLIEASSRAFAGAAIAAAAFCVLAVILGLVVSAGARARFLAYIRTIGLAAKQVRALVALEIVPLAAFAILAGVLLGLYVPHAILPAVDLRPFTGGAHAPPILIPAIIVAGLGIGLLIIVALAVFAVAAVDRRRGLGAMLRVGDQR